MPCSPLSVSQRLGSHIPEDDTLHNHHCENLKSYKVNLIQCVFQFKLLLICTLGNLIVPISSVVLSS
jgi:hypothetical protein